MENIVIRGSWKPNSVFPLEAMLHYSLTSQKCEQFTPKVELLGQKVCKNLAL